MKIRLSLMGIASVLAASLLSMTQTLAANVTHLQVRVVTGAEELTAGSELELRIYPAGRGVLRLPLTHGESWPRDSTRVIPVSLPEPLDPRGVLRFSLFYRASSPLTPPWEVIAADVDVAQGREAPELLLNATLSGVITRQGELASETRAQGSVTCVTDADCDDHRACNGPERCGPGKAGADARGCIKGTPLTCPVNQVCTEERGCRGLENARPTPPAPAAESGQQPPTP